MRYQIIRSNDKFFIRKVWFIFSNSICDEYGILKEFSTEEDALDFLYHISQSKSSYHGIVVRELKTEDYYND